jgi:hypothetical protein
MEPEEWEEHWDGFDVDEQVCAEWYDWLIIRSLMKLEGEANGRKPTEEQ